MDRCSTPKKYLGECLHAAVRRKSIKKLNRLLSEERIFINCSDGQNCYFQIETPLFTSIKQRCAPNFIKRLITVGGDVNKPAVQFIYPLHLAVTYDSTNIAELLIKNGADLNVQDADNQTPLHWAVLLNNLELVCLLLYYEANVGIKNSFGTTPLTLAVKLNRTEIAEALIGYYDDVSKLDVYSKTALDYAVEHGNSFALELVNAGAEVNYISYTCYIPLINAMTFFKEAELFKLIWSRIDYQVLFDNPYAFLLIYLEQCPFSDSEWLECLYLILSSPNIFDLIEECRGNAVCESHDYVLMSNLLNSFVLHETKVNDRLRIIYHCLSHGAFINPVDINCTVYLHGFNEEIEAFIYTANLPADNISQLPYLFYLPSCMLGLRRILFETPRPSLYFKTQFRLNFGNVSAIAEKITLQTSRYFSITAETKRMLKKSFERLLKEKSKGVFDEFLNTNRVPSLVELSRDKIRHIISKNNEITKTYHFHDIVKGLDVPLIVKDILRFKVPLYK